MDGVNDNDKDNKRSSAFVMVADFWCSVLVVMIDEFEKLQAK
jgi:hypothetical protein